MTPDPLARSIIPCINTPLVNPIAQRVSIRIRERRHALGLSQSALAELAGVSPELVSRIERGRCLPSLPTLVTFSSVLRTTPNDLLEFEEPLGGEELRPLLDAVNALGPAQRSEIQHIAEALAKYQAAGHTARPTPKRRDALYPPADQNPGKDDEGGLD
jgi:transcriptional regulator with XRE-family HTH domain